MSDADDDNDTCDAHSPPNCLLTLALVFGECRYHPACLFLLRVGETNNDKNTKTSFNKIRKEKGRPIYMGSRGVNGGDVPSENPHIEVSVPTRSQNIISIRQGYNLNMEIPFPAWRGTDHLSVAQSTLPIRPSPP